MLLLKWADNLLIMQVFEFHFNPRTKEETIYDSFCYEPENIYERKLGNLYIIGELNNVLPPNIRFLDTLSSIIKKEHYARFQRGPEQSLRESLKGANQYLEDLTKRGNVSWLGNLNLTVLSIVPLPPSKDFIFNFTKVGNLKILLLRGGDILDMGQNLEFQELSPYPSRVFGNIVTGKLTEGDKIMVFTKEVFRFFLEKNLIEAFAKSESIEQKKIKEILKPKEKDLESMFGLCFLLVLTPEVVLAKEYPQAITFKAPKLHPTNIFGTFLFLLKLALKLVVNQIRNFGTFILRKLPRFKKETPKIKFPSDSEGRRRKSIFFALPKFRVPRIGFPKIEIQKKNLISVLVLILFLVGGFFIFKTEREKPYQEARQTLEEVKLKISQGENSLIFKDERRANELFQEAWKEISPLTKTGAPLNEEALALKETIEEKLFLINKLEKVEEPELIFEFGKEKTELIPQRVVESKGKLYFFNSFSSNLYKLELENRIVTTWKANRNLKFGASYFDSILFFSDPNFLIHLKDSEFQERSFETPLPDFYFNALSIFRSNIYFLDAKSNKIIKYPNLGDLNWGTPEIWLKKETPYKFYSGAGSMTIDGSIWILTADNKIIRCSGGVCKENLVFNFFPYLENPTKIWTSENHSYLYLLEPVKKRIVILTKQGGLLKQYQSDKFDSLLDFAVSKDGKTIWLLNGLKLYQISIQ